MPTKKAKGANLTPKQRAFAREYLVDHNGAQAAIRAGCPPKSAKVTASRWLTNANIRALIANAEKKVEEETGITVAKLEQRMWDLSMRDDDDATHAAQVAATAHLMKARGCFVDRLEVTGRVMIVSDVTELAGSAH